MADDRPATSLTPDERARMIDEWYRSRPFQWLRPDGAWSSSHTTDGECSACRHLPDQCPRCGDRLHHEVTVDENGLSRIYCCQAEHTDEHGHPLDIRPGQTLEEIRASIRRPNPAENMWGRVFVLAIIGGALWLLFPDALLYIAGLALALPALAGFLIWYYVKQPQK